MFDGGTDNHHAIGGNWHAFWNIWKTDTFGIAPPTPEVIATWKDENKKAKVP